MSINLREISSSFSLWVSNSPKIEFWLIWCLLETVGKEVENYLVWFLQGFVCRKKIKISGQMFNLLSVSMAHPRHEQFLVLFFVKCLSICIIQYNFPCKIVRIPHWKADIILKNSNSNFIIFCHSFFLWQQRIEWQHCFIVFLITLLCGQNKSKNKNNMESESSSSWLKTDCIFLLSFQFLLLPCQYNM